MAFRTNAAPYQRAKNSTLKIMLILLAALLVVWGWGIVYSFQLQGSINGVIEAYNKYAEEYNISKETLINMGVLKPMVLRDDFVDYGIRSILMVVIAVAVTAVCDVVTTLAKHKKDSKLSLGKEIVRDLIHNYSWISAIIFTLCLPVYTSYYVVIIGSIFATVVCKNFFGGFGKNIFNPAIMARIFVGLCFGASLSVPGIFADVANGLGISTIEGTLAGVDSVTGATLTTAFNNTSGWLGTTYSDGIQTIYGSVFTNYTMVDLLMGNYVGALGETFTIVIFALGIILSVLKVINWRTPVFYLGTVALTSLVIALVCGFDSPINYVLYHLSLGGVMFGAVFMLTDPVTGPTSPFGKSLVAVFAGLMTVLIRVQGGYPEGVMYSIALCNLISPAVDYFTVGKSNSHLLRKTCIVAASILVSIGLCTGLSVNANGGRTQYEINGIDRVQYEMLTRDFNFENGEQLREIKDYQVKNTSSVKALVLDAENNISLAAAYEIVDKDGNRIAIAYSAYATHNIDDHGGGQNVTAYALVAIKDDGSIYGINVLSALNTAGYASEGLINTHFTTKYNGLNESTYGVLDAQGHTIGYVAGATYSSQFMNKIIAAAYAEYNA